MFSIRQNFLQRSTRLPKKSELLTLNTAYLGQPFVEVVGKNENTLGLDVSYNGQPFVAAFNNRLTGPIASGNNHIDVQNWLNNVSWAGGSASNATILALNTFCAAIDNAGIRNKFYRLNLFCGNNLQACLVPLYTGPSSNFAGLQNYGYGSELNFNFVSSDYVETGASGGLKGNGSTKYLNSGFPTNSLPEGNRHLAVYEKTKATNAYDVSIGSEGSLANTNQFQLATGGSATDYVFCYTSLTGRVTDPTSYSGGAFWVGCNSSTAYGTLYKNGSSVVSGSAVAATPTSAPLYLFTLNRLNAGSDFSDVRLSGYSTGLSMDSTQVTAYYNAIQAFQTSLTRNV